MNVVATLSHLSNTYSDDTQMDCASCFCNLSCNKENQELMVKQVCGLGLWLTVVRRIYAWLLDDRRCDLAP